MSYEFLVPASVLSFPSSILAVAVGHHHIYTLYSLSLHSTHTLSTLYTLYTLHSLYTLYSLYTLLSLHSLLSTLYSLLSLLSTLSTLYSLCTLSRWKTSLVGAWLPVCLIAALLTHNHCRGALLTHAVQDRCLTDSALTDPGTAFSLAAARFTTHVTGVSGARQTDEMRRDDRRAQETKDQDSKKLQRRVRGRVRKANIPTGSLSNSGPPERAFPLDREIRP